MPPLDEPALLGVIREALKLPAAERRAFVLERCNGDESLRRRAEQLLNAAESATLMEPGEEAGTAPGTPPAPAAAVPVADGASLGMLGSFTLLGVLGEGGMGVVYLAQQEKPRRVVALKVVRPGLITPTLLKRFEHEVEVLARLQHPGIAQVYEAGTAPQAHGGAPIPYFAMEMVKGETLTEYARSHGLLLRERVELVIRVCDAVQHAHAKGVIHRDLKPGNILVPEATEGETGGGGPQPKVLDFGIARVTDQSGSEATLRTEAGQVIGTIPYMSPEQIGGRNADIDTRTDVYALGVILFELLTGRRPHSLEGKTIAEAARTVELGEPVRLGTVDRTLRGDLETIVSKALSHERERRYQSASELGADLGRFLRDEPVQARPASRVYQIRKFARRNRDLVAGLVAAFVILVAGVIGTSWMAYRATEQRREAEAARVDAERATANATEQRLKAEAARAKAETETANALAIRDYLDRMFSSIDPEKALGHEVTVREIIDDAAGSVGTSFVERPRVEASIRATLANTYRALGRTPEATEHARAAYERLRETLGEDDAETIDALRRLAAILADGGEFEEAERLTQQALDSLTRLRGPEDPETGATIGEMGRILQSTGRMKEAEEAIRRSLAICRPALGDHEYNVMITMHNLATCLKDQGRFEEAEAQFRELLTIRTEVFGEKHPQTAYTMNNLAACLQRMGKSDEALELFRKTLEIRRATLGDDHPSTLVAITNCAGVLLATGRLAEAEPLVLESVEASSRRLGESDSRTLIALNNLAYLQEELGKLDEAEGTYRRVIEIREKSAGARDPETWGTMNNLAMLLQRVGRLDEAGAMFEELLRLSGPMEESIPHLVAIFRNNYGDCLTDMKRYEEAETALVESVKVLEAKFGTGHARVKKGKGRLVRLYEAWGKEGEAGKWRE